MNDPEIPDFEEPEEFEDERTVRRLTETLPEQYKEPVPSVKFPKAQLPEEPAEEPNYWVRARRRGDTFPETLLPRSLRDLALILGERLTGIQMARGVSSLMDPDKRARLDGYEDCLYDVLELLTDDEGNVRPQANRVVRSTIHRSLNGV